MNIGALAAKSGVSAKRIRYYEQTGLLHKARRSAAGYRTYDERDVHTLRFVQSARQLGFSMTQIADLLALWSDQGRHSADVKVLARTHIEELQTRIEELQSIVDTLQQLVEHCDGDDRPECPILTTIAGESP